MRLGVTGSEGARSRAVSDILAQASSLRARRVAERCVELLEEFAAGSANDVPSLVQRVRSFSAAAALAVVEDRAVSLTSRLEVLATAFLQGSSGLSLVQTQIRSLLHAEGIAPLAVAVASDMIYVVESVAGPAGAEAIIAADIQDGWLMLTVKAGIEGIDILPMEAAAAIGRICRLADLAGGVARRRSAVGGFGMAFTIDVAAAAAMLRTDAA